MQMARVIKHSQKRKRGDKKKYKKKRVKDKKLKTYSLKKRKKN